MSDTQSQKPLDVKREEFRSYLETAGVLTALTNVLVQLYEMEEKPVDPLEFMRTHMTETISERVELNKLKEEFEAVTQRIYTLQQENMIITNRLKELEPSNEMVVDVAAKVEIKSPTDADKDSVPVSRPNQAEPNEATMKKPKTVEIQSDDKDDN